MSRRSHDQDALWETVQGSTRGVLATVSSEGTPHLSNVHYLTDPRAPIVRLTTTTTRVKGRNLLRDPRAVLHVQGHHWFNFAVVEGTATVGIAREPGDDVTGELYDLITTLRGPADRADIDAEMIRNDRMIVRLDVKRVYGQIVSAAHTRGSG